MTNEAKDQVVEFMSKEEALMVKNKEFAENQIKDSEDKIIVNKVVVAALEKELQKLRRSGKANGNSK